MRKRPLVAMGVPRVFEPWKNRALFEARLLDRQVSWTRAAVDNRARIRETLAIRPSDRVFHLTADPLRNGHVTEILFLAGRLLFGALFVYNGVTHFRNCVAIRGYCAYKHVPMPGASAIISGLWLLVAGSSVVVGFRPEIGLVLIALFLLGVTPVMPAFWNFADPAQGLGETINFTKNPAAMGAAR